MLAQLRSQLTFANVVALMALFAALSGGAYALTIPKNSVSAKQLQRNAVTRAKIKKGAVTSSKVKDRSLLAKDFKLGQMPAGPRGPQGAKGDTGAQGPRGAQGIQGPAGPSQGFAGVTASGSFLDINPDAIVSQTTFTLAQAGRLFVQARGSTIVTCNPTQPTVNGGLYVDGGSPTTYAAAAAASGQVLATGNGAQAEFRTFGITPVLSAGAHTISYRIACPGTSTPTSATGGGNDGAIGAVLVGS